MPDTMAIHCLLYFHALLSFIVNCQSGLLFVSNMMRDFDYFNIIFA